MLKIGLLSDTHGILHSRLFEFFSDVDEIWHAGDIGNIMTADRLADFKPLKAVHGNIDGQDVRRKYPAFQVWFAEDVRVAMIHIGGHPAHYDKSARELLEKEKPALFITGHSHILRVMYDKKHELLFMNPGAAGISGFHKSLTMLRFVIEGKNIRDLEILDIPLKKQLPEAIG